MYNFLIGVAVLNFFAITIGFYHVDFEAKHEDEDENAVKPDHSELSKLAIFNRVTLLGAAYILIYAGVEVTMGGWGLTWLTEGRHGEAAPMLQVVSGYWGGLAFGRILLGYLCNKFGEKLMITVYTAMIIVGLSIMHVSTDLVIDSIGNNSQRCNNCKCTTSINIYNIYSFYYSRCFIRSYVPYNNLFSF